MMLKALLRFGMLVCALLTGSEAIAQGAVQQIGTVTSGDAVVWWRNGQITDSSTFPGWLSTQIDNALGNTPGSILCRSSTGWTISVAPSAGLVPESQTGACPTWISSSAGITLPLTISNGGTGATTASGALTNIGAVSATATHAANSVFAAPSGSAGVPTFRSLVTADIPQAANFPSGFNAITGFGDSITAGNEDGTGITWPNQLATLTSRTVNNQGVGGQTSSQIAVRMNAYAGGANQQFATGFTIPTSGSVTVTFPTGFEPCYNVTSGTKASISTAIGGTTYSGVCTDNGSHVYSFTPSVYPGSPVTVPSGNQWLAVTGNTLNGCIVIEEGRNNYYNSTQVLADIAASVATAKLTGQCYAVMTILNAEYEPSGSANYNSIIALNNTIKSLYGANVIDIRANLIANYNPANATDVIDYGNDVPPYSLRAQDVSGTLSAAITTTTQTSISLSGSVGNGVILTIGTEQLYVTAVTGSGPYTATVTRGYAGTTAATYANGTAYTGVDALHPGQNTTSASNPNCTNGYICMATAVQTWLSSSSGTSPYVPLNSLNTILTGVAQNGQPITGNPLKVTGGTGQIQSTGNGGWQFYNVPYIYGCNTGNICTTSIGDGTNGGWANAYFTGNISATTFKVYSGGYTGTNYYNLGGSGFCNSGSSCIQAAGDNTTWQVGSNFLPSGTRSLGSTSAPWNGVYSSNSGFYILNSAKTYFVNINTATLSANATITLPGTTGTVGLVISGTSSSIGGSALTAGTCASTTVTMTGATTGMVADATPVTYPGAPYFWNAYVSAANTVTVSVCAPIAGTPTASTYNVRVIQ